MSNVSDSDLIFCIENFLELPEEEQEVIMALLKNSSMESMTINLLKEKGILLDEQSFEVHRKINMLNENKK